MAAFSSSSSSSSYQHLPFHLLDSVFLQKFPTKMPGFSEVPNTTHCFPQFYRSGGEQTSLDVSVRESSSCLEQSKTKVSLCNNTTTNNEESVTTYNNNNKQSTDSSSMVLGKVESGDQVNNKVVVPMENKRKFKDGSSFNSAQSKDKRDQLGKSKKQKKSNGTIKKNEEEEEEEEEKKVDRLVVDDEKKKKKKKKKVKVGEKEEAPVGYIHVRARRGQATDSHSLAERVRREKISERMKLLQALVPGCDKVTGKALMLDEIINYVQSMQNQIEFLSAKLASVNPMFYDFGVDLEGLMLKPEADMQQGSPNEPTGTIINTFSTPNNYHPLLDTSTSLVFQQGQMPNILSQSNGQILWDVDEQGQKFINQCGLFNTFGSFH